MAAAKTVLAAAILALGFSPAPGTQSSPFYFILDWRLEIVTVHRFKINFGTPARQPDFAELADPHPKITRRSPRDSKVWVVDYPAFSWGSRHCH